MEFFGMPTLTLFHHRPAEGLAVALIAVLGFTVARADNKADTAPAAEAKVALDKRIMTEIAERSEIMTNLAHLSDVIGPRLTGSARLEQANRWTAEKMKEYGLENVRLEPWEIPIGWERGTVSMKLISPNERTLLAASAGWAPGTKGKITGEVVVLNARTKADLEQYKGKLQNAIVLRSPPSPIAPVVGTTPYGRIDAQRRQAPAPRRGGRPEPEADKADEKQDDAKTDDPKKDEAKKEEPKKDEAKKEEPKRVEQPPARRGGGDFFAFRQELNEFLKAEGAAAVLMDSGKPHKLLVTTGSWGRGDRGNQPDGPASLYVAHEDYALLYRLITEHKLTPQVELEVTNTFVPGPVTVYNTVGEIVGSEKPDEFVVIGAHLDSWDLASGTTDNGTGSSIVLEAARVLGALAKQGVRPKRTIRFALFSGEEQGLHGSRQYVQRHKDEMPKTSLAIVHDTGTGKVLSFGVLNRTHLIKVLGPELETLREVGFEGLTPGGITGGTDHWSFHQAGVPGFAARQDSDEYRFTHHTQSDTFDKAKEPNLIQGAQVMAVTAMRVANMPELLPREMPKAESQEEPKPEEKK
jgi:carboxypeptidase Q